MLQTNKLTFRTIVKASLSIIAAVCIVGFIIFQARYLIIGPRITLIEEPIGPQNERQVFLAGTARNISHLWLNDRPIYTAPSGHFKEAVILENGYTIATLRAEDRYGRSTMIEKSLVYAPASFVTQ